jgi:hypothetical protein
MIRSLRDDGQSERAIAKVVGYAPSTVHEVLQEDPAADASANGNGNGAPPEPTAGQQTIDGGEVPAPDPPLEEIRVDGTTQLGFFDAGGKAPQTSSLRLTGGKVELVDGRAFKKGDVIDFSGTAVVREVAVRDKADGQTGIVISAEQKHTGEIIALRIVSS